MKKIIATTFCAILSLGSITNALAGDLYEVNVSTTLMVRAKPDSNASSLGTLKRGAEVEVNQLVGNNQTIGGVKGRWAEIDYKQQTGYVFTGFLKPINTNTNAATDNDATSSTTKPANTATPGKAKHANLLAELAEKYPSYYANGVFVVDDSEQRMYWYKNDKLVQKFTISTAANGLGNKPESNTTPAGAHRISTKIGKNAARGAVFDKLQNTGEIAKIYTKPNYSATALVLSRILRLDGLEPGKNKGGSVDTFNRAIYFHGTNKEGNLGKRASHGCIRMKNDEVIELFGQVSVDTLVYIQP
ncbi:MAG: L,D-transpeptidase family protein [Candidatus Thiocaldithrix dubininis]|uniref:L,D-transpeptidase family protein n=1 Tax=Candidatus Thiocaldithrix dubininis TaxID=3080823 RepID=A0AA95HAZ8_9GAMM|nr:MAG: L,D-transpeptidase family protein [Candidatus Thiocaldithrix dubininis]